MFSLKIVSRSQAVILSALIFSIVLGFVYVGRSKLRWPREIQSDTDKDGIGSQYVRDHRGYLYPKEYFQFLPKDLPRQFHNVSLRGRHSDSVMPRCQDLQGNNPVITKKEYQMIGPFKYLKHYKNPCWWEDGISNKSLVCIPYFYFIGTPKAGTTDLFWRMEKHPHIAPVNIKEQRWFGTVRFREEEKKNFKFYVHQFDRATKQIHRSTRDTGYHHHIVGDGSPTYMFANFDWFQLPGNKWCLEPRVLALSYIHHLLPTAKLILLVRNPVDRLYSDYLFNSARTGANSTPEEFHEWAKISIQAHKDCYKVHPFRYCLYSKEVLSKVKIRSFTSNIYSRLILDVLKIFPRNQLLVLQMEDYSANIAQHLEQVFGFLGLDPISDASMAKIVNMKQYNKGKSYKKAGPMLPATRKMVSEFYKPFNEELAQILQDKKYLWREE